jgi:hypothetical protein
MPRRVTTNEPPGRAAGAAAVPTAAEVNTAVAKANKGNPAPLRLILRDFPQLAGQLGGDLPRLAIATLIDKAACGSPAVVEALHVQAEALRGELSCAGDTAADRMLVESAVAGWLLLWHLTLSQGMLKDPPIWLADHYARQAARAQRRMEGALKALAVLRRLLPRAAVMADEELARPRLAAANPPTRDRPPVP